MMYEWEKKFSSKGYNDEFLLCIFWEEDIKFENLSHKPILSIDETGACAKNFIGKWKTDIHGVACVLVSLRFGCVLLWDILMERHSEM